MCKRRWPWKEHFLLHGCNAVEERHYNYTVATDATTAVTAAAQFYTNVYLKILSTWIIKPNNNNMVVECWVIHNSILWNPFSISSTLLHFTPSLRMQSAQKDQRDEMQVKLHKIVKVFKLHKIRNAIASSASSSYMVVGVSKYEKRCKWSWCCKKVSFPSFLFVSHFYTCSSIPLIHLLHWLSVFLASAQNFY